MGAGLLHLHAYIYTAHTADYLGPLLNQLRSRDVPDAQRQMLLLGMGAGLSFTGSMKPPR